jgi:Circularly permutated YpsA SLOG family
VDGRDKKEAMNLPILKIVSGGQTGADRAGLDWAMNHGIPHGGWCPKARRAEDGPIDAKYQLRETTSSNYVQRTEWNVRDSVGTVIFSIGEHLTGGSLKTVEFAIKHQKPHLHLSAASKFDAASELKKWLQQNSIRVLNVAGPRASKEPEVAQFVISTLDQALPHDQTP